MQSEDESPRSVIAVIVEYFGLIHTALAILSILSIHALFFSIQMDVNYLAFVDANFVGNITFTFGLIFLLCTFAVRVGPYIISFLLFYTAFFFFLITSLLKINFARSFYYDIFECTKTNFHWNIVFFPAVSAWLCISLFYLEFKDSVLIIFSTAILVTCGAAIVFADLKIFRSDPVGINLRNLFPKSFKSISDMSYYYGYYVEFSKMYFTTVNKISMIALYVGLLIIAAHSGQKRFAYLLKQDPFVVVGEKNHLVGNYIGSTTNGVIYRDCLDGAIVFIAFDDGISMKKAAANNLDETFLHCH